MLNLRQISSIFGLQSALTSVGDKNTATSSALTVLNGGVTVPGSLLKSEEDLKAYTDSIFGSIDFSQVGVNTAAIATANTVTIPALKTAIDASYKATTDEFVGSTADKVTHVDSESKRIVSGLTAESISRDVVSGTDVEDFFDKYALLDGKTKEFYIGNLNPTIIPHGSKWAVTFSRPNASSAKDTFLAVVSENVIHDYYTLNIQDMNGGMISVVSKTNDSHIWGYTVKGALTDLVASAPDLLNTLKELGDFEKEIGIDDATLSVTISENKDASDNRWGNTSGNMENFEQSITGSVADVIKTHVDDNKGSIGTDVATYCADTFFAKAALLSGASDVVVLRTNVGIESTDDLKAKVTANKNEYVVANIAVAGNDLTLPTVPKSVKHIRVIYSADENIFDEIKIEASAAGVYTVNKGSDSDLDGVTVQVRYVA